MGLDEAIEGVATTSENDVFDFGSPVEAEDSASEEASEKPEPVEAKEEDGLSEESEEETSEEVEETEEAPAPNIARKKPFHIETKDGTSKLPPDTLLSIKVEGKISKVPLADAVDAWNSKAENEKAFISLSQREKEVSQEVSKVRDDLEGKLEVQEYQINTFNEVLSNFHKMATNGNALAAFAEVLEAANLDSLSVVQAIRDQLLDAAVSYSQLSPAERKAIDAEDKLRYYEEREIRKQKKVEAEQARRVQETNRQQVLTSFGIPDAQTYKRLHRELVTANNGQPVSPEQVGAYYKAYGQAQFVGSVLQKVDKTLMQDKEYIGRLVKLVDAFDPSPEELEQTIRQSISTQETGASTKSESKKPAGRKPQRSGETKTENRTFRGKEDLFL